jgi:hypothetical protein
MVGSDIAKVKCVSGTWSVCAGANVHMLPKHSWPRREANRNQGGTPTPIPTPTLTPTPTPIPTPKASLASTGAADRPDGGNTFAERGHMMKHLVQDLGQNLGQNLGQGKGLKRARAEETVHQSATGSTLARAESGGKSFYETLRLLPPAHDAVGMSFHTEKWGKVSFVARNGAWTKVLTDSGTGFGFEPNVALKDAV